MIGFTAVTAAASWAGVWVAHNQWKSMNAQLQEMKSGSADTHNLAVAAQNQAIAMDRLKVAGQNQAVAASRQADATLALANGAAAQLKAITATADAAKQQAAAAILSSKSTDRLAQSGAKQVEALFESDRPWVAISLPNADPPVVGQDWVISAPFGNVGKSAGFDVSWNFKAQVVNADGPFEVLSPCSEPCSHIFLLPGEMQRLPYTKPAAEMDQKFIDDLQNKKKFMIIQTYVEYKSSDGRKMTSQGCYWYAPKLGFTSCRIGNKAQ